MDGRIFRNSSESRFTIMVALGFLGHQGLTTPPFLAVRQGRRTDGHHTVDLGGLRQFTGHHSNNSRVVCRRCTSLWHTAGRVTTFAIIFYLFTIGTMQRIGIVVLHRHRNNDNNGQSPFMDETGRRVRLGTKVRRHFDMGATWRYRVTPNVGRPNIRRVKTFTPKFRHGLTGLWRLLTGHGFGGLTLV